MHDSALCQGAFSVVLQAGWNFSSQVESRAIIIPNPISCQHLHCISGTAAQVVHPIIAHYCLSIAGWAFPFGTCGAPELLSHPQHRPRWLIWDVCIAGWFHFQCCYILKAAAIRVKLFLMMAETRCEILMVCINNNSESVVV